MRNEMSNRINAPMGESRTTLLRGGVLVVIAVLVATAVWLGARSRSDDNGGTDTTSGDSSSQGAQNISVEQVAPAGDGEAHGGLPFQRPGEGEQREVRRLLVAEPAHTEEMGGCLVGSGRCEAFHVHPVHVVAQAFTGETGRS